MLNKISPRIVKYPNDMKMAYMQQEADLDNTKTAFEDESDERRETVGKPPDMEVCPPDVICGKV